MAQLQNPQLQNPQLQNPQLQSSSALNELKTLGTSVALGGGLNSGIAVFQKAPSLAANPNIKSQFLLRPAHIGAQFATGALSSIPAYFVNKATNSMSTGLANYYSQKDNSPNLYHAGLIAAPAAFGGMYSLGAITHSLKKGKDLMKSKSLKELGGHMLEAANPVQHIKSGWGELKQAVKYLSGREKAGIGTKLSAGANLLFLAAGAAPALYSYFTKRYKEDKKPSPKQQALGYVDDVGNAISAATATPTMPKVAAYIPIMTPVLDLKKGLTELSKSKELLEKGELTTKRLGEIHKGIDKNRKRIGYDALGLATLGGAGYGAYKYKKYKESSPFYRYQG